jgi:hypothetical protein
MQWYHLEWIWSEYGERINFNYVQKYRICLKVLGSISRVFECIMFKSIMFESLMFKSIEFESHVFRSVIFDCIMFETNKK